MGQFLFFLLTASFGFLSHASFVKGDNVGITQVDIPIFLPSNFTSNVGSRAAGSVLPQPALLLPHYYSRILPQRPHFTQAASLLTPAAPGLSAPDAAHHPLGRALLQGGGPPAPAPAPVNYRVLHQPGFPLRITSILGEDVCGLSERDWDYVVTNDGFLASPAASNASDCCQHCQDNPLCLAFTWNPTSNTTCLLKNTTSEDRRWNPGVVSGTPFREVPAPCQRSQPGIRYSSPALTPIANIPNASSCCQICRLQEGCSQWSYWLQGGQCLLLPPALTDRLQPVLGDFDAITGRVVDSVEAALQQCPSLYHLPPNQTLQDVAALYWGISWQEICCANQDKLLNCSQLEGSANLTIPCPATANTTCPAERAAALFASCSPLVYEQMVSPGVALKNLREVAADVSKNFMYDITWEDLCCSEDLHSYTTCKPYSLMTDFPSLFVAQDLVALNVPLPAYCSPGDAVNSSCIAAVGSAPYNDECNCSSPVTTRPGDTFNSIADLCHRNVSDIQQLNRNITSLPSEPLPSGVAIAIPNCSMVILGGGADAGGGGTSVVAVVVPVVLGVLLLGLVTAGGLVWRRKRRHAARRGKRLMVSDLVCCTQYVHPSLMTAHMEDRMTPHPSLQNEYSKMVSGRSTDMPSGNTPMVVAAADLEVAEDDRGRPVLLGEGAFSRVYAGRMGPENIPVALKVMKDTAGRDDMMELLQEVSLLRHAQSPHIVTFYGPCFDSFSVVLVFERMASDLLHALKGPDGDTYRWHKRGRSIMLDVAKGLEWLHCKRIVHRDIKSLNVFLDDDGRAKIGDMGMSKVMQHSLVSKGDALGTLVYAAPEVFTLDAVSNKVDIYAAGVVMWELVTGERPVMGGLRDVRVPEECSASTRKLILACTGKMPEARPTATQLREALEEFID